MRADIVDAGLLAFVFSNQNIAILFYKIPFIMQTFA